VARLRSSRDRQAGERFGRQVHADVS
jgi:hypothetical protein